jgi:hypothetical protein
MGKTTKTSTCGEGTRLAPVSGAARGAAPRARRHRSEHDSRQQPRQPLAVRPAAAPDSPLTSGVLRQRTQAFSDCRPHPAAPQRFSSTSCKHPHPASPRTATTTGPPSARRPLEPMPDCPASQARRGEARRSEARRSEAKRGEARRSEARRGEARRGEARRGEARRGEEQDTVEYGSAPVVRRDHDTAAGRPLTRTRRRRRRACAGPGSTHGRVSPAFLNCYSRRMRDSRNGCRDGQGSVRVVADGSEGVGTSGPLASGVALLHPQDQVLTRSSRSQWRGGAGQRVPRERGNAGTRRFGDFVCQRTARSPGGRTSLLPARGHEFSRWAVS